ncbi:MAG: twin-arginine translocation signal domain-containing protein [Chloroflexi bacterium]|nr:MAG: twin-arginine translocation signal domain-containing protein [Chloroflexota bacterium]
MARFTRRQFLKLSGAAAGVAAAVGATPALVKTTGTVEASEPQLRTSAQDVVVPTVCLLCPSGCGMIARVADGRVVKMEGSPMHPINLGALCPKGQAAPELLYNPDRLKRPLRRSGERGAGQWQEITWDEAISAVAQRLQDLRAAGHPEQAVLMYGETRGQLRSFFEYFMRVLGSPNTISKDSLNVEAAKLATYYTQGIYNFPNYDLENTNYILSFGANLLEAGPWVQRTVAGHSFMRRGRATRGKIVVIDPRQGITGSKADEWIPIRPGTDAALALGMAHVLIKAGLIDFEFVHEYGFGFEDFTVEGVEHKGFKNFVLENYDPRKVEEVTGVPATTISRLAGEFANNQPGVAMLPGKGGLLNGSINGLYAAMAIHILNALVGNIDKPGGVQTQRYLPCTPWPELPSDPVAEAGRARERVDGAGTVFPLGRHAYQAVADRVLEGSAVVDTLFLYDANPVFETPAGQRFVEAFHQIPFIVAFTSFMDESAQYADLVLPEPTFLERWEDDHIEGLGYPGIALRQPVIEPLYDTMHAPDFLLRVAQAMGSPLADALPWPSYEEVLKYRLQNIGTDWDTLKELGVWLVPGYHPARRGSERWVQEVVGSDRRSAPRDGRFDFYSREMNCALNALEPEQLAALGIGAQGDVVYLPHAEPIPYQGDEEQYPLHLNVITLMSLGPFSVAANMPSLMEISGMTVGETWRGWAEMNPETARRLHLDEDDEVVVESPYGRVQTRLKLVPGLRPDTINLPYNFGHTAVGRYARNRGANGLSLMPGTSEPATGLAAFTNTRVRVYKA